MTQKEYILQELRELKSTLAGHISLNPYAVPAGYFEGLTEQILRRIKALDAATAAEELKQLSVLLAGISKQMPYQVPVGYFEGLAEQVMRRIRAMEAASVQGELEELSPILAGLSKKMPFDVPAGYFDSLGKNDIATGEESAAEELSSLSPLLAGMKKEVPYHVPAGYFENLAAGIIKETKPKANVVSITSRSWFRYAAAAAIVGVVTLLSIGLLKPEIETADKDSYAWVKKNVKKVSTDQLEKFVQLADGDKSVAATTVKDQDVKDLIKDVPQSEIQGLLDDTQGLFDNNTDDDENVTDATLN